MWRAFFLATGIFVFLLGFELFSINSLVIRDSFPIVFGENDGKTFVTEDWMPWALLTAGCIVCLYAFTLPKRFRKK